MHYLPHCAHSTPFAFYMKFSFSFLGKISDFHKANMSISIKLNMHKNWQVIKANGNDIAAVRGSRGGGIQRERWPRRQAGGEGRDCAQFVASFWLQLLCRYDSIIADGVVVVDVAFAFSVTVIAAFWPICH